MCLRIKCLACCGADGSDRLAFRLAIASGQSSSAGSLAQKIYKRIGDGMTLLPQVLRNLGMAACRSSSRRLDAFLVCSMRVVCRVHAIGCLICLEYIEMRGQSLFSRSSECLRQTSLPLRRRSQPLSSEYFFFVWGPECASCLRRQVVPCTHIANSKRLSK
mmetsp:Transcript_107252/g.288816  ORF Transcript_107252/g.288816 Transcript_107252/m.288816 type:complete len:161 (-) Transcript_107252:348-830(-)